MAKHYRYTGERRRFPDLGTLDHGEIVRTELALGDHPDFAQSNAEDYKTQEAARFRAKLSDGAESTDDD